MNKKTFSVQGMHCASCSTIINNILSKEDAISSVDVNFALQQVTLGSTETLKTNSINKTLKKHGYKISEITNKVDKNNVISEDSVEDEKKKWQYQKMILSVTLAIIAIIAMILMIGFDYQRRPKNLVIHHLMKGFLPLGATIMLTVVGRKYVLAIVRYIRYGHANMDTLVGIGTVTAFIYSFIVSTFHDLFPDILGGQVFYEAVIVVIGFIELGKYLEGKVMSKTGQAIKALVGLQAKFALVKHNNEFKETPIDQVKKGDIVLVKSGEKIPLDGKITTGSCFIDEAMITGEPIPVKKSQGEQVIGGTICKDSTIEVLVEATGSETYLQKIIAIVHEAQNSKPAIQKLADSIMQYFVPTVLIIALLSGLFWIFLGAQVFPGIEGMQFGLLAFVGVLVIACPCGLGLATPMAIITGIGQGAKHGILAKNAEGLLQLRKATMVVFDKTGTITSGKPELVESTNNDKEILTILTSLESLSSHPIAQAITEHAKNDGIEPTNVENFKTLEGIGITGDIGGNNYTISKPSYLETVGIGYDQALIEQWTKEGKTPLILTNNSQILGYYAVADTLKDSSIAAIETLKSMNITPVIITGDHQNTAEYIAQLVGIEHVHAGISPEQKATIIKKYQQENYHVCMVGDGINDAPALATADIGVAMSTGTDVAIESASLTLLHGDLSKLIKAISISKLTQSAIKQNLAWAFGFNLIGIPLAAGLFYPILGVMLNPAFEGIAMSMSSLTVMLNSLRLQKKKL